MLHQQVTAGSGRARPAHAAGLTAPSSALSRLLLVQKQQGVGVGRGR